MLKTIISIGHFKVEDIKKYLSKGFMVVAYEPRKDVYKKYLEIDEHYFVPQPFAVVANSTVDKIGLKIIRDRLVSDDMGTERDLASSTYQKEQFEDTRYFLADEYFVKTVSIHSVLEEFDNIEELFINCEGEEVPIIMENPVDLFLRCKKIYVEFHCHVPYLNMTEQMVLKCVKKWKNNFEPLLTESLKYKPWYQFNRRD